MKKLRVLAMTWSDPKSSGLVRLVRVTNSEAKKIRRAIDFVEKNADGYGDTTPRVILSDPINDKGADLGDADFNATMLFLSECVHYSTYDDAYTSDCPEFEAAGARRARPPQRPGSWHLAGWTPCTQSSCLNLP